MSAEVSSPHWGILSTGRQLLGSLTCSLQQLHACVSLWTPTVRKPERREENRQSGGGVKAIACCSQKLWKAVCLDLDCGRISSPPSLPPSAFHTVLSGLAFNSGRTVFTN